MANTSSAHNNAAQSTIKGGTGGNGTPLKVGDRIMTAQTLDGLKFPSGTPYMLTIGSPSANNYEIVQATSLTGDTFTLQRGREGTQEQQWPVGEPFSLRVYEQSGDLFGIGPIANGLLTLRGNTAQALAASGTITTAGLGISRVNPGAACTGVILQAGTVDGQVVVVENTNAANTVTMAAAGTSHVADGVSDVIAVLTSRMFTWNATAGLWSRAG